MLWQAACFPGEGMEEEVIDSWQLRMFSTLSRTGSFTETARRLRLTQSAISHALRKLEEDMGRRLLQRRGRRMDLTPAGRRLLLCADAVLAQMTRARTDLAEMGEDAHGRLRVVCPADAARHLLPAVLEEFHKLFPNCAVRVLPAETTDPLRLLTGQDADFIFGQETAETENLTARPAFTDVPVILLSTRRTGAAEAGGGAVDFPGWIGDVPCYILQDPRRHLLNRVETHFRRQGAPSFACTEIGSSEALVELVKMGLGAGIAPAWTARAALQAGLVRALPLPLPGAVRRWSVMHLPERELNPAEEIFASLCQSLCARHSENAGSPGKDTAATATAGKFSEESECQSRRRVIQKRAV